MNNDFNLSISTKGVAEKAEEIAKYSNMIKEAINDINGARSGLIKWVSVNKDKYDNRLASALSKMNELTEVIDSYSAVAFQTSEKAVNIENKIAKGIDNILG